jgi:RNA recognition motif-containing protein
VSTLFMVNIPYNCTEAELSDWTQSSGVRVESIHMIRDMVAGVSPCFAYVELADEAPVESVVRALNGRTIRDRVIMVSEARRRAAGAYGFAPGTAA